MAKLYSLITAAIFIFLTANISGQGYSITGKLQDSTEKSPLTGAHVLLSTDQQRVVRTAITDTSGRFVLEYVSPGEYKIEISHVGYYPYITGLTVADNDVILEVIRMKPDPEQITEVTIREQYPMAVIVQVIFLEVFPGPNGQGSGVF